MKIILTDGDYQAIVSEYSAPVIPDEEQENFLIQVWATVEQHSDGQFQITFAHSDKTDHNRRHARYALLAFYTNSDPFTARMQALVGSVVEEDNDEYRFFSKIRAYIQKEIKGVSQTEWR